MGGPQLLRDVLADDALLVTPEEAAALLRIGRTTVYALMKAGDLRPVHIGRSCRLPRSELDRYIDGLTSPVPMSHSLRCRAQITAVGPTLSTPCRAVTDLCTAASRDLPPARR